MTTRERFDAKWSMDHETGCWPWTAGKQHDYGAFRWAPGRSMRAHRVAWVLYRGDIPQGRHVLHRCDTPLCVNPDHLFLGSNRDNVMDRHAKGRSGAARGLRNGRYTHPERTARGESAGTAKLTARSVRAMRRAAANGLSYSEIGRRYGVSNVQARNVVLRKSWAHVR